MPTSRLIMADQRIVPLSGPCTFGRAKDNTVRLEDDHVSRNHALIQCQGEGEFWIVDLGSSNGTLLNSRRISRPARLSSGDVIEMGGNRMVFESDLASPSTGVTEPSMEPTRLNVVRRKCWLMVADIEGFTRMSREKEPEEVPRITGSWFKECRTILEKHGGNMNQYLGDGFLAYWEDEPEAATRVLETLKDLTTMRETCDPSFRVVLHYGTTVLGGVPTLSTLNLHGPSVNFTFRMEKIAASWKERILCGEDAWKALGVPSSARYESSVAGFDGTFVFHVPSFGG